MNREKRPGPTGETITMEGREGLEKLLGVGLGLDANMAVDTSFHGGILFKELDKPYELPQDSKLHKV